VLRGTTQSGSAFVFAAPLRVARLAPTRVRDLLLHLLPESFPNAPLVEATRATRNALAQRAGIPKESAVPRKYPPHRHPGEGRGPG